VVTNVLPTHAFRAEAQAAVLAMGQGFPHPLPQVWVIPAVGSSTLFGPLDWLVSRRIAPRVYLRDRRAPSMALSLAPPWVL